MKTLRVVFIGCVDISQALLERLLAHPQAEVVGTVTRTASRFNADFCDLSPLAAQAGVPVLLLDDNDQERLAGWIGERRPDVVYCFGWSWLLAPKVLDAAPLGVVGYHPALLPRNRGRHPIIWALALGLEETGSTFFIMDGGADSGDILHQERLAIGPEEDAGALYRRLKQIAPHQMAEMTAALAGGTCERRPQDHSGANVWRKRGKADGRIDWRMPASGIVNLVRALARPYMGAHCRRGDAEVVVWKARAERGAPANIEPGKVLAVDGDEIVVKCGGGAVRIIEHEFTQLPDAGEYLP
jgi:methionyl-tRNA formyltransferase